MNDFLDKSDTFNITLEVDGRKYTIPIQRGDEESEAIYREAAKQVQLGILQYKQVASSEPMNDVDILSMLSIQLAQAVIEMKQDTDTQLYQQKIQQLTLMLDNYLK
jgi:hypothetical protein